MSEEAKRVGGTEAEVTLSRIQEITAKHNISVRSGRDQWAPLRQTDPRAGFVQREQILQCIQEYANISVWAVHRDVEGNPVVHVPLS